MINDAITAEGLVVVRGRREVLHGLNVRVQTGAVTGLLGASGCGKTTFMRAVIGAQVVRRGVVTVLGRAAGHAELRSQIGYASQSASVYSDLTVVENLKYFAAAVRAGRSEVGRVLDLVDMTAHAGRLTGRLSGGERSRVSLAVAMLGEPPLLVLDEPTVGLDPVLREDLWRLFARLAAQGTTLLVSSHVMDEAERCDQLILMRDGAVLVHETPAALKERTGAKTLDAAFLCLVQPDAAA